MSRIKEEIQFLRKLARHTAYRGELSEFSEEMEEENSKLVFTTGLNWAAYSGEIITCFYTSSALDIVEEAKKLNFCVWLAKRLSPGVPRKWPLLAAKHSNGRRGTVKLLMKIRISGRGLLADMSLIRKYSQFSFVKAELERS